MVPRAFAFFLVEGSTFQCLDDLKDKAESVGKTIVVNARDLQGRCNTGKRWRYLFTKIHNPQSQKGILPVLKLLSNDRQSVVHVARRDSGGLVLAVRQAEKRSRRLAKTSLTGQNSDATGRSIPLSLNARRAYKLTRLH